MYEVAEVTDDGRVIWMAPDSTLVELTPAQMMQHGLTDKAREALNAYVDAKAQPEDWAQQKQIIEDMIQDGKPGKPPTMDYVLGRETNDIQGGYSDDFRWDKIVDGDDVLWSIDNRPAIEQAVANDERPPELQRILIPAVIIQLIARQSP